MQSAKCCSRGRSGDHENVNEGGSRLLGLRGKAGGGSRVTAGPKRPHLSGDKAALHSPELKLWTFLGGKMWGCLCHPLWRGHED